MYEHYYQTTLNFGQKAPKKIKKKRVPATPEKKLQNKVVGSLIRHHMREGAPHKVAVGKALRTIKKEKKIEASLKNQPRITSMFYTAVKTQKPKK